MIVFYLWIKDMSFDAVHHDLVRMLGHETAGSFTPAKYARSANFVPKKNVPAYEPLSPSPAVWTRHLDRFCWIAVFVDK
jgi:hypothetical protein